MNAFMEPSQFKKSDTRVAVQFPKSAIVSSFVLQNKERHYIDVEDDKKIIVIYEERGEFVKFLNRIKETKAVVPYIVLENYIVDMNEMLKQTKTFIREREAA